MKGTLIRPVADCYDKQRAYQRNMQQLRRATENGFYLEAIVIEYAMMEDRLLSFLRHAGLLCGTGEPKIDDADALALLAKLGFKANKNGVIEVKNISTKSDVIRETLKWSTKATNVRKPFLKTIKDRYEGGVDIQEMLDLQPLVKSWCKYRNEAIHSLLNKNMDSLQEEIVTYCRNGENVARRIDAQVRSLKKYRKDTES